MQTNIDITKALIDEPNGVLSIHQLSKKLNLPYGTAYNRLHLLYDQGIIQILHSGKSKLCALNPENRMTVSLLSLGAAQNTEFYLNKLPEKGIRLLKEISSTIKKYGSSWLYSTLLLSPDTLTELFSRNNTLSQRINPQEIRPSLDFFFIKANENYDEYSNVNLAENTNQANGVFPQAGDTTSFNTGTQNCEAYLEKQIKEVISKYGIDLDITSMVVEEDTLIGMFSDKQDDVGLTAYTMLHQSIILYGFENFYEIAMRAFIQKLSELK